LSRAESSGCGERHAQHWGDGPGRRAERERAPVLRPCRCAAPRLGGPGQRLPLVRARAAGGGPVAGATAPGRHAVGGHPARPGRLGRRGHGPGAGSPSSAPALSRTGAVRRPQRVLHAPSSTRPQGEPHDFAPHRHSPAVRPRTGTRRRAGRRPFRGRYRPGAADARRDPVRHRGRRTSPRGHRPLPDGCRAGTHDRRLSCADPRSAAARRRDAGAADRRRIRPARGRR
jgi:hypothetical protein